MMWYSVGCNTLVDKFILVLFIVCGIARLARFNVTAHLAPKDPKGKSLYFEGLPIPYAGLLLSASVAICHKIGWESGQGVFRLVLPDTWFAFHPAMFFVAVVSAMMISKRLRVTWDGTIKVPILFTSICAGLWLSSSG